MSGLKFFELFFIHLVPQQKLFFDSEQPEFRGNNINATRNNLLCSLTSPNVLTHKLLHIKDIIAHTSKTN